jgi:hypothetical protein
VILLSDKITVWDKYFLKLNIVKLTKESIFTLHTAKIAPTVWYFCLFSFSFVVVFEYAIHEHLNNHTTT